ncbi:hypothetical protein CSPX01_12060, partial [Colletotrichum filicis]
THLLDSTFRNIQASHLFSNLATCEYLPTSILPNPAKPFQLRLSTTTAWAKKILFVKNSYSASSVSSSPSSSAQNPACVPYRALVQWRPLWTPRRLRHSDSATRRKSNIIGTSSQPAQNIPQTAERLVNTDSTLRPAALRCLAQTPRLSYRLPKTGLFLKRVPPLTLWLSTERNTGTHRTNGLRRPSCWLLQVAAQVFLQTKQNNQPKASVQTSPLLFPASRAVLPCHP